MVSNPTVLRLHREDNVAVAVHPCPSGYVFAETGVRVIDPVPAGHKVAVEPIGAGGAVRKYGQIIGVASVPIPAGAHVHSHNMEMAYFDRPSHDPVEGRCESAPMERHASFQGIVREDGRVATRNYLCVIPTVGCASTPARMIADAFRGEALRAFPNVDGVVALTHTGGCAMPMHGEPFEGFRRCLTGHVRHPNVAGVLLVGLGCEVNQLYLMLEDEKLCEGPRLRGITIQSCGGTEATVRRGIRMIEEMLPTAQDIARREVPASHLIVGLECGGSDAHSGITANPALGAAVDLVVAHGGTAVLSETTEIYGAEHLLIERAASGAVARRLMECVKWWERYSDANGFDINNNPTPGNKEGGLTTILEKSLGAVAKGGTTRLMDVVGYAEQVTTKGFVFMDTPAYDLPSVTGMVAGGANVVCFTTGCGSTVGCKPSPVIKLASNTPMFLRMAGDMDIDCGVIADGGRTVEEMGEVIFRHILDTASGLRTRSELLGYGDCEFYPWQKGAML